MNPTLRSPHRESDAAIAPMDRAGRWYAIVAPLCVAFLAFVAGAFVMYRGLYPAEPLRRAFQGGVALFDRTFTYNDPLKIDFWQPARTGARGVTRYDATRAQVGLTLYTSGHAHRAFLIDMSGRVMHEWSVPYSGIWERGGAVKTPRPDPFIYIEKSHVFPNGDLLALYAAIGDTPWGYGLVKVDRNGRVIWKYLGNTHHDFSLDEAGNIYVLTQEISEADLPGFEELHKPRIDDFIVKLSPQGRELHRLWLTGAFAQSRFGRRLLFSPWQAQAGNGDYLHTNSVEVLKKAVPGIPDSRHGQILVSLRELSTIALMDMDSGRTVWATTGPWVRQHDAKVLPNGHILLFDNEGGVGGPGPSRVLEFDPGSYELEWSYGDRPDEPLNSAIRSSQSRLANGNTLIVESMAGRLVEVTPTGDVVWEYVNPVRGGPNNERIPIIFWVQRVDPQRDLTPEFRHSIGLK
jgi:hypothetical protein